MKRKTSERKAIEAVKTLLSFIGEDPTREGIVETPLRYLKAWKEFWGRGYDKSAAPNLKVFDDGGEAYDEMVVVRDIKVFSHCEHHLAPFYGTANVAYIPSKGRIVGLSKINRLVDFYARRLQVQERLTTQIAEHLAQELEPLGVAVHIKCKHLCVCSRGIEDSSSFTETSKLLGVFRDDKNIARKEFLSLIKG